MKTLDNNDVICEDCGESTFKKNPQYATWYESECYVCKGAKICTQVRDFKFGAPIKPANLSELRNQIDSTDSQIFELINQHNNICSEIAQYKIEHNLPVLDP